MNHTYLFQNIHVSFLRTVPPYSHQADVWVELLKHLGYRKVIFIHSSDTDGRALLGRFQSTSQSLEDDVEMKVQVTRVRTSYTKIILSAIYFSF
jgi:ionotropic glutamate receptor NMDA 1